MATSVKARPVALSRSMTTADAFRVILLECLAQVSGNVGAVRARKAEGVHQMRVGLRRLHVALSALHKEFRAPAIEMLRSRAKSLADDLALARDLDVFLAELFEPVVACTREKDLLAILRTGAERARDAAWDGVVATVPGEAFNAFLDDAAGAAQGMIWLRAPPGAAHTQHREAIGMTAPRVLDDHLARVRKRAARIQTGSDRDLHRLRIALKKLRYAAEFFAPLYGKKRSRRYVNRVRGLIDLLGTLHDVAAARETLARLTAATPDRAGQERALGYAAGLVTGWHEARAHDMTRNALKAWTALSREAPFWR